MNTPNGFSDNPFMIGYDSRIFEGDKKLGFKFPQGKFITSEGFCSLDKLIEEIKRRTGYPTILNIGDSSTSGWNSDRTFKGNNDPHSAFFTYKTYSDLMRGQLLVNVINAGVPGYTSLQGKKYLEDLLKRLASKGIIPDYVTIYFGNNDCTYNQFEDKLRLDFKKGSPESRGERVSVQDYKKNIAQMIETVKEYGAKPIIIVPLVRYEWEPGVRSMVHIDEFEKALGAIDSSLKEEIERARELYFIGERGKVIELDRVLPRIKPRYRRALFKVARETKTPIIDVQSKIRKDNEHFVDYCHPNERTNQMIVDKFREIRNKDLFYVKFKDGVAKFVNRFLGTKKKEEEKSELPQLPTDTYTLY